MLNSTYKFKLKDFLKKDYAHNPEEGTIIANEIIKNNTTNKDVEIDFKGISTANTAFCNMLYEYLNKREIKWGIKFVNCNSLISENLKRVKENFNSKESNK